jgi:hypothetical protein
MNELYYVLLALGLALLAVGLLVTNQTARIAALALSAVSFVVDVFIAVGVL